MNGIISKRERKTVVPRTGDGRLKSGLFLLMAGMSLIFLCSPSVVLGDISRNITIDPVGDYKSGDVFEISGTTTLQNPEFIIMQINPKEDYEIMKKWISETKNPDFSFSIESDAVEDGGPGNITRFYADGRSESRTYPMPINRAYPSVGVTSGSDGISTWSASFDGKNFLGDSMKPGEYSIVVIGGDKTSSGVADTDFSLS